MARRAASSRSRSRNKPFSRSLEAELEALDSLSHADLKTRWNEPYEVPCPPQVSRLFLLRAVAYRIQENALGGLDRVTRRRLEASPPT